MSAERKQDKKDSPADAPIVWGILPAAGKGARMELGHPKALARIGDRSILNLALDALLASPYISKVVVVLAPGMQTEIEAIGATGRVLLAEGGETRQASVRNALKRIEQGEGIKPDFIVIHDAARCLVSSALIERCILAAFEWQAVTAAVPIIDTVNRCSQEGILTEAIQRDGLVAIQTPQVFSFDLLWKAHQQGDAGATDDASLVSKLAPVRVVPGDRSNIKITYPEDLQEAHRLRS